MKNYPMAVEPTAPTGSSPGQSPPSAPPRLAYHITEAGSARVRADDGTIHLIDDATAAGQYSNAQITDYTYADFALRWRPPLRLTLRAWASRPDSALLGTAGFGFWNHPFSPSARRLPRLPRAIWFFFAGPPSNLALAHGVPGQGWLAMTIDATRPRALALIPLALPAVLLMQAPSLYNRLWPRLQRALSISQKALDGSLLAAPHTYTIDWRENGATFAVDGATVLETPAAPRGPMGFIAWIDNQYAVVTPRGRFGWGLTPLDHEQSLAVESIQIEPLPR